MNPEEILINSSLILSCFNTTLLSTTTAANTATTNVSSTSTILTSSLSNISSLSLISSTSYPPSAPSSLSIISSSVASSSSLSSPISSSTASLSSSTLPSSQSPSSPPALLSLPPPPSQSQQPSVSSSLSTSSTSLSYSSSSSYSSSPSSSFLTLSALPLPLSLPLSASASVSSSAGSVSTITTATSSSTAAAAVAAAAVAAAATTTAATASVASANESIILSIDNITILTDETSRLLVNITRERPINVAIVLLGYLMPFIILITIIANSLVIIVLSQRTMITPTNIILLCMTISDLLTIIFPTPWYFYMYTLDNHTKLPPCLLSYIYMSMTEVIPTIFHNISIWLTLLLAGQRYIYVCHTTIARKYCTLKHVIIYIIIICIISIITQISRFFDRSYNDIKFIYNNKILDGCKMGSYEWATNTYFFTYFVFRIIFIHIGPCTALVLLNSLLFNTMKNAQKTRAKLFKENRKSECKKLRDSNCTTLMLIVVVSVFLIVEIPLAIATILHVIQNMLNIPIIVSYEILNLIITMVNFFMICTYPLNFAIYCGMSKQFRETFKSLFLFNFISNTNHSSNHNHLTRYSVTNGPHTATNETIL